MNSNTSVSQAVIALGNYLQGSCAFHVYRIPTRCSENRNIFDMQHNIVTCISD
jgi:hypothetical protein